MSYCKEPSTMTCVCGFIGGKINLSALYHWIPIIILRDKETKEELYINCDQTKRPPKIDFFGVNGVIISAKYEQFSRGYRRGGKHLNNVVSIDYQICDKNINFKISEEKMHISGILNEQMMYDSSYALCNFIKMIQENIDYFRKINEETRIKTLDFLIHNISNNDNKLIKMKSKKIMKILSSLKKEDDKIDKKLIMFYLSYLDEYTLINDYISKIKSLSSLEDIIISSKNKEIEPLVYIVVNGVYIHDIKQYLNPISIQKYFEKHSDIVVDYLNIFGDDPYIEIDCEKEYIFTKELDEEKKKYYLEYFDFFNKTPKNKFKIFNNGKIRQSSPCFLDKSLASYKKIYDLIQGHLKEKKNKSFVR